jgi:hypothetical protein
MIGTFGLSVRAKSRTIVDDDGRLRCPCDTVNGLPNTRCAPQ